MLALIINTLSIIEVDLSVLKFMSSKLKALKCNIKHFLYEYNNFIAV